MNTGRPNRSASRGFTLVEVGAVIGATALVGMVVALSLDPPPPKDGAQEGGGNMVEALARARQSARQIKDSTQLRGIHQGLIMWAQNNNDEYPLPSRVDRRNVTVAEEGRAKDTTANIFSIMIANGTVTPEFFVSPLEPNDNVRAIRKYEYDSPRAAVNPRLAHWDPAMRAGLTKESRGHISYAHIQPAGGRRGYWGNTFVAKEWVLANRGPEVRAVEQNEDGSVVPRFANMESLTLRAIGERDSWSGHVVGNDNHVALVEDFYADGRAIPAPRPRDGKPRYKTAEGMQWPDVLFVDEADDPRSRNLFLSLFTSAGDEPGDYEAIWD